MRRSPTASGRGVMRVPFSAVPLALYDGREFGYAAVAALGAELRRRGFVRIRVRLGDERIVRDLAAPAIVPPALGMPYVRARCALNGFAAARVERADPREVADLEGRARAELRSVPPHRRLRRADLPVETVALARFLIGKLLDRAGSTAATPLAGRIVETEAYGPDDPRLACLSRPDRAEPVDVRRARPRLRVLHLWNLVLPQRQQRSARASARPCCVRALEPLAGVEPACANSVDAPALRDTSWRAGRETCAARSRSAASSTGWTSTAIGVCCSATTAAFRRLERAFASG